ncbi:hypothetical protein LZ32DRAFT_124817 [Colletotrichum eremochloae]|nr:hypothetical protein LZ32DRAFT_124817 [Colletotrichum eremochloae]
MEGLLLGVLSRFCLCFSNCYFFTSSSSGARGPMRRWSATDGGQFVSETEDTLSSNSSCLTSGRERVCPISQPPSSESGRTLPWDSQANIQTPQTCPRSKHRKYGWSRHPLVLSRNDGLLCPVNHGCPAIPC